MDFRPVIPRDPIAMDPRIFGEGAMDLREDMLSIPLDQRFTLDEQPNLFFVNLERFALRSRAIASMSGQHDRGGVGSELAEKPQSLCAEPAVQAFLEYCANSISGRNREPVSNRNSERAR